MRNHKSNRFNPTLKLARHKRFGKYCNGEQVFPINVEISPTGKCNAKCPWCFYDNKSIDKEFFVDFEKERLKGLMYEFSGLDIKAITWTGGGEPTIYPDFKEIVDLAYSLDIEQGLFTNALATPSFDPSKLSWIRSSKTDKDWNVKNLKSLRGCKTLGLCVNYTGDDDIVRQALDVGEEVGADYVQVRPALKINGLLTEIEEPKIDHPLLRNTGYKFAEAGQERPYNECEGYHFIPFIWQNGNLDVCGYHWKNPEYNLGNLYQTSLKKIMQNAPQSVQVVSSCQTCCKLNEVNILINEQKGLEDINFP